MSVTVAIGTLGRPSLAAAVASCVREGFPVLVIGDGVDVPTLPGAEKIVLGRNYGKLGGGRYYSQIALTVGAFLVKTEYVWTMDDDDEVAPGSGLLVRTALQVDPRVDLWIPGLRYKDGREVCMLPGLRSGNVAKAVYRTTVFAERPMYHMRGIDQRVTDYYHVAACAEMGFRVAWLGQVGVLVRPCLEGDFGAGD